MPVRNWVVHSDTMRDGTDGKRRQCSRANLVSTLDQHDLGGCLDLQQLSELNFGSTRGHVITGKVSFQARTRSLFVVSEGIAQVMRVPYQIRPLTYYLDTFQVTALCSPLLFHYNLSFCDKTANLKPQHGSAKPSSFYNTPFSAQVETYIALLGLPTERKPVSFWVIALSIFGGAILLMLLVLLLWLVRINNAECCPLDICCHLCAVSFQQIRGNNFFSSSLSNGQEIL